jgi:hypothetical protein
MSFFIGDEVALTATASSGLTVQFSTLTPDICSISPSGLVRFVAVGACTVAADQPGNADVAAAAQVTKTLTVGGGTRRSRSSGSPRCRRRRPGP